MSPPCGIYILSNLSWQENKVNIQRKNHQKWKLTNAEDASGDKHQLGLGLVANVRSKQLSQTRRKFISCSHKQSANGICSRLCISNILRTPVVSNSTALPSYAVVPLFMAQDGCTFIPSRGWRKGQRRRNTATCTSYLSREVPGTWHVHLVICLYLASREMGKCSPHSQQQICPVVRWSYHEKREKEFWGTSNNLFKRCGEYPITNP